MLCYLIKPSTMTDKEMESPECMKRIKVQVCNLEVIPSTPKILPIASRPREHVLPGKRMSPFPWKKVFSGLPWTHSHSPLIPAVSIPAMWSGFCPHHELKLLSWRPGTPGQARPLLSRIRKGWECHCWHAFLDLLVWLLGSVLSWVSPGLPGRIFSSRAAKVIAQSSSGMSSSLALADPPPQPALTLFFSNLHPSSRSHCPVPLQTWSRTQHLIPSVCPAIPTRLTS